MNTKIERYHITREKLSERGIVLTNQDSVKLDLLLANLIFNSMNDENNPLYVVASGGITRTAKNEALIIKSALSLESFDELDLFIEHHTLKKQLNIKGTSTEEEIKSTFDQYGVVLINGLYPEHNPTLILGCGHDNGHFDHINKDTLDIRASLKPDALLQWGDKRATEYLGSLKKYHEIIDEGPLCKFMQFSEDFFAAVRSCLIVGGKLRLPSHILEENKIPTDFMKEAKPGYFKFGSRFDCATYTYVPDQIHLNSGRAGLSQPSPVVSTKEPPPSVFSMQ